MNKLLTFTLFGLMLFCLSCAKKKDNPLLKPLLAKQLKSSYSEENWFAPTKIVLAGLTAEQANWKDSTKNHSIGELISHLTFWNEMQLRSFQGEDLSGFKIDNDTTFKFHNEQEWKKLSLKLDSIQNELLQMIEKASEEQLSEWANDILSLASHNAYHSGQIIYIRKQKGWWNR